MNNIPAKIEAMVNQHLADLGTEIDPLGREIIVTTREAETELVQKAFIAGLEAAKARFENNVQECNKDRSRIGCPYIGGCQCADAEANANIINQLITEAKQ